MKLKKQRWRNKGLWLSLSALVLMVLKDLGFDIAPEHFQQYVSLILGIMVMAGVISDPNEGEWYNDEGEL